MPRKNKRKLSEYDLAVRVVFEEISGQLSALVAIQKRWLKNHSQGKYRPEPGKRAIQKMHEEIAV
jgi:hypothetical protein